MPIVACPHCGCRQPAGDECRVCHGRLFNDSRSDAERRRASLAAAGIPQVVMAPGKTPPGLLRRIWRISNWLTLAALVVVVLLILRPAPAPGIYIDAQAKQRAAAKLHESLSTASGGQPTELRLDEAELNAFLASNLGLEGMPDAATGAAAQGGAEGSAPSSQPSLDEARSNVKDVKVTMQGDRMQAYVLFDLLGKDMTLVLEGRLAVKDGYLRFEPSSGKIGSLPIPQSALQAAVARLMDSPANRNSLRLPDGVKDVRIENGQLVVAPKE
jgi:hypothetical protein